jgi:hypothetical protein
MVARYDDLSALYINCTLKRSPEPPASAASGLVPPPYHAIFPDTPP